MFEEYDRRSWVDGRRRGVYKVMKWGFYWDIVEVVCNYFDSSNIINDGWIYWWSILYVINYG